MVEGLRKRFPQPERRVQSSLELLGNDRDGQMGSPAPALQITVPVQGLRFKYVRHFHNFRVDEAHNQNWLNPRCGLRI